MNTMSTRNRPSPRHARIGGVLASLLAASVVLSGCSSSGADAGGYEANAEYSGADAAYAEEPTSDGNVLAAAANAESPATDRAIIITGGLYMTVEDPIAAADQASGIVQKSGGRIDARSETAPDERDGGSASLTLRVPSDDLDAVVDDLRELGTVDQFTTDSYDVTTEVTDLKAKISTLRASTKRIEALLLDAKDISDIIKLETELDGRQAELESLEARQRGLNDQVSMSTIDLSLTTEPVMIVDDAPENFWDGLTSGWNTLVAFLSGALVVAGVLLPWLALMAIIAVVVVAVVRSRKSRKPRQTVAPTPHPEHPAQPVQPEQQAPATSQDN